MGERKSEEQQTIKTSMPKEEKETVPDTSAQLHDEASSPSEVEDMDSYPEVPVGAENLDGKWVADRRVLINNLHKLNPFAQTRLLTSARDNPAEFQEIEARIRATGTQLVYAPCACDDPNCPAKRFNRCSVMCPCNSE